MPNADEQTPTTGPYGTAAAAYHRAGWSPLPLPARTKAPVPKGWTGASGATPSGADVHTWTEDHPDGNIALRLPPHVIGIDVDHYDGKPGALVLHQLETQLGALPPTWRTTSRDDGVSGIRLYRIPTGLRWPGGLGPGIDTIRFDHRYAVAWPSTHPNGGTYRWYTPDGLVTAAGIPDPDDLPDLPDAWITHFTGGETATDQPHAGLDTTGATTWLTTHGQGAPCRHLQRALSRGLTDLATTHEGGRHDAALRLINRMTWLAADGHTGALPALQQAGAAFLAATAGARRAGDAEAEWDRMVTGAVDIAAGRGLTVQPDPCTDPFAGLIPKETKPSSSPSPAPTTSTSSTPVMSAMDPASSATSGTTTSPAGAATDEVTSTTDESVESTRTTWWPRDLTAALAGDIEEEHPVHLVRSDGHPAFYPARVNGLIGPSESGKTWVACHAIEQAVNAGGRATIIDLEDSETGTIARLLAIGLTRDQIDTQVAYINPDEPFHPVLPTGIDLAEHLATWAPELVILDGFNAAMTLQGLDLKDNKDATVFMQTVLKPIAKAGPTVVYIDHTPKDKEHGTNGGIGAQAKRAMTTGCTLAVEPIKPFGKGQNGRLRLHVDKDRLGSVRGVSAPGKSTHWYGDLVFTSHPDGTVTLEVTAPDTYDVDQREARPFRPTAYMDRVSTWLADNPGAGRNEILGGVTGDVRHLKTAIKALVDEGWVTVTKDGQRSRHTVRQPFSDMLPAPSSTGVGTGVAPGSATPADPTGVVGLTGGYVVPRSPTPGEAPRRPGLFAPEAGPRIVHRVVAGKQVLVNLDTGNIVQRDDTTDTLIDTTTGEVLDDGPTP